MIKRSTLVATAIVFSAGVGAFLSAPGCSSKSEDTPPTTGGASRKPPPRPAAKAAGKTQWFAIKALKLGLSTRDGKPSKDAWKDYGFDLDSRNTTREDSASGTNTCRRRSGSKSAVLADGNEGIDNNFGQHVMAIISSLKSDAEEAVTQAVTDGSFTLLLKIDNYTDGDNAEAPGFLYVANEFGDGKTKPTFGASETGWKIVDESLADKATISNPKLKFPTGYVSQGYWVSGDFGQGKIPLDISLSGATISLPIESGIISFRVSDGKMGTIAGAMNTDELKNALTPVAKRFGICPGQATYDQVVEALTSSADLVSGKPNLQDPAVECNAISIALGFDIAKVGDHSSAPIKKTEAPTGPDECAEGDAGTDGGKEAGTDAATDTAGGG